MARLNFLLLIALVACALLTVSANHKARKLTVTLEREQNRMRDLDVEWGQLQIEQQTWAGHGRVEAISRQRLAMKKPPVEHVLTP
jgi:cell division protein FtsL